MKRAARDQKLVELNHETIRKLDASDLEKVIGGGRYLPRLPPPPPTS